VAALRQFLKGWGANLRGGYKRKRKSILEKIQEIDRKGEATEWEEGISKERRFLEGELENLMEEEEIYWQQRGGEKWSLEGDKNTEFFHLVANGRRRKKTILSLEQGDGVTMDPRQIRGVIYNFYKQLFGSQDRTTIRLSEGVWRLRGRLTLDDNVELTRPFLEEEVRNVVFGMKENFAPGPDGLSVCFYKSYWETIKGDLMGMVNDFYMGNLDIDRLNYGVINLIPKVREANNVKQFRPICLLNVSFKIFTKLIAERLAGVAKKIIIPN
jgi:mannosylglycoprotein endo-beta-mannosidase